MFWSFFYCSASAIPFSTILFNMFLSKKGTNNKTMTE